jgi:hypothetical protein
MPKRVPAKRGDVRNIAKPRRLNPAAHLGRSKRLDVRWPDDVLRALEKAADIEERGVVDFIRWTIRRDLEGRGLLPKRRDTKARVKPVRHIESELPIMGDIRDLVG